MKGTRKSTGQELAVLNTLESVRYDYLTAGEIAARLKLTGAARSGISATIKRLLLAGKIRRKNEFGPVGKFHYAIVGNAAAADKYFCWIESILPARESPRYYPIIKENGRLMSTEGRILLIVEFPKNHLLNQLPNGAIDCRGNLEKKKRNFDHQSVTDLEYSLSMPFSFNGINFKFSNIIRFNTEKGSKSFGGSKIISGELLEKVHNILGKDAANIAFSDRIIRLIQQQGTVKLSAFIAEINK